MSGEIGSISAPLPFVLQQWTRRWWLSITTSIKTFPRSVFPTYGFSHLSLRCPSAACGCLQIHGSEDVMVIAPAGFAGVSPKKIQRKSHLGREKEITKKMVFLTDMWWGTDLGLSWFGRPFAPETRLKKGIFPINQRKMGTACNKARCIHVGLHVSFIPKASLSLRDHKSSTKSVFIKEKYREFLSFPRGEILMLCGKSRGQAYVWSTTGCCC